jgi:dCTP deaminase
MILTGPEIAKQVRANRIRIDPFDDAQITTNSYDLRLGRKYLRYTSPVIDVRQKAEYEVFDIPETGLMLEARTFLLAETYERFGSDHYVPLIHAKSGTARSGLFVHVTADLIDIGSFGKSTLQLYATIPVKVYPGMLIAQVTFWTPTGDIKLYEGKYQNSQGPMPSMTYLDYQKGPRP